MAILGFTGQMPVAIGLSWKGDIIANTMTTTVKDESYVLANESLTELKVTGFFATKTTNPNSNRAVGTEITVFDLRATLAANPAGTGFVMDPYLDKTVMKPTADELLIALNRPDRQKSGKATDFLAFTDFHPLPLPPGTDLRGRPDSIRKSLVPNV
jgi:hypothetical protein